MSIPKERISSKIMREERKTDIPHNRILVVEDEPMVLLAIKSMISKLGINVDTAENGSIAVDRIRENNTSMDLKYDLVFMDINMPVMNGYVATQVIKDLVNADKLIDVPIICLSAQDCDTHKKMCEEAGFSEQGNLTVIFCLVEKPISYSKLKHLLLKYKILNE